MSAQVYANDALVCAKDAPGAARGFEDHLMYDVFDACARCDVLY